MVDDPLVSTSAVAVMEVMDLNKRSLFGRVVVNPPSRTPPLVVHSTGEVWNFCGTCSRGFLHRESLIEHVKEHNQRSRRSEAELTESTRSMATIQYGIKTSNKKSIAQSKQTQQFKITKNGQYQCLRCFKVYVNRYRYSEHAKLHTSSRRYKCQLCGAAFKVKKYLQDHVKKSHSARNGFKCERCPCKFATLNGVSKHRQIYHKTKLSTQRISSLSEVPISPGLTPVVSSRNPGASHPAISKRKMESSLLKMEVAKIDSETATNVGQVVKPFGENKMQKKLPVFNIIEFKCDICLKILSSRKNLRNHRMLHTGEKPYLCKHCGSTFRVYDTLAKHIKGVHFGSGTFRCSYCDSSYQLKHLLKDHLTKFHNVQFM